MFMVLTTADCAEVLPESIAVRADSTGICRPFSIIQRCEKRGEATRAALLRGTRSRDGLGLAAATCDNQVRLIQSFSLLLRYIVIL